MAVFAVTDSVETCRETSLFALSAILIEPSSCLVILVPPRKIVLPLRYRDLHQFSDEPRSYVLFDDGIRPELIDCKFAAAPRSVYKATL